MATGTRNHPIMKGLNVVMIAFSALQAVLQTTKAGEKLSVTNFLGIMTLVLAFTFFVTANYCPPNAMNLAVAFDQVAAFLSTTSVFLFFLMFLPHILLMKVVYGLIYLGLVIVIVLCTCNKIVNEPANEQEIELV